MGKIPLFLLFLLLTITFILGCTDQETYLIKVEQDAVFVENKKVANTADIAKQDSFLVEALQKALESRKDTSKNCQIKIDPEQSYNVLFKIVHTCDYFDFTNADIITEINGEKHTESIFLPKKRKTENYFELDCTRCLDLGIDFAEDYFLLSARGSSEYLFYNENLDSAQDELSKKITVLYNRFIDVYKNSDDGCINSFYDVYISALDNTKVSNVIPIIQKLKAVGSTKIILWSIDTRTRKERENYLKLDNYLKSDEFLKELNKSYMDSQKEKSKRKAK
jgi:biopolymer transport protein ExbD